MSLNKAWAKRFREPIPVPSGEPFRTLRDAGEFIDSLPPRFKKMAVWQAAAHAVLTTVEHNGPTMLAEMGIRRALSEAPPSRPKAEKAQKIRVTSKVARGDK